MELVDDYGNTVFETIKITLVCDDCMKTDRAQANQTNLLHSHNSDLCLLADPEKCRHKLASMPRWLSSAKVETVRKLLAEVRTTILCQHVASVDMQRLVVVLGPGDAAS